MTTLVYNAIPYALFDAIENATGASSSVALPARSTQITWQTFFGTAPDSVGISLEVSQDNIHWDAIDTSTAVAGEIKTVTVNAAFIRANITAVSGGDTTSVLINAKDL